MALFGKKDNEVVADQAVTENTEPNVSAPEPEAPKDEPKEQAAPEAIPGTDGKVTMKKDGVGRRYHVSRIREMQMQGWKLVE